MPQAIAERTLYRGAPAIRLQAPDGASAILLLHGGHLVSWIPAGGQECLYMSELAQIETGRAVRGGVPIIFPQFSNRGPLPKHGFARNREWTPHEIRAGEDYAMASLRLCDDDSSHAIWPHSFAIEVAVSVTGQRLDVEIEVSNTGETDFDFTTALHTYLRVKEVEEVQLEGLNGYTYTDCTQTPAIQRVDTGVFLAIENETDRVYQNVERPLLLRESHRALGIHAENMPDVIVWNPWETGVRNFNDMPARDFRRMLCVEAGAVERPIALAAGASWWGRQTLVAL